MHDFDAPRLTRVPVFPVVAVGVIASCVAFVIGGLVWIDSHTLRCGGPAMDARRDVSTIQSSLWRYAVSNPTAPCPTLVELIGARTLVKARLRSLRDPWHRAYQIRCPDDEVEVCSAGPDGRFATRDDIYEREPRDPTRDAVEQGRPSSE